MACSRSFGSNALSRRSTMCAAIGVPNAIHQGFADYSAEDKRAAEQFENSRLVFERHGPYAAFGTDLLFCFHLLAKLPFIQTPPPSISSVAGQHSSSRTPPSYSLHFPAITKGGTAATAQHSFSATCLAFCCHCSDSARASCCRSSINSFVLSLIFFCAIHPSSLASLCRRRTVLTPTLSPSSACSPSFCS